jgi:MerR family transcriptional regulator, mercuric resistance operon regulatory protein
MANKKRLTIGELARRLAIATSTIRYYERIGLLAPEERSSGNYRLYGPSSLRRLHFIRAAQSIGFTLDDVRALAGGRNGASPSCRHVQLLIEKRLAEIETQLANLGQVRKLLKSSLRKCRVSQQSSCCHVITALERRSDSD